jgi:UDP-glucose 4-epimerase
MARCLVTGHKGYIGAHLVKKLEELGHEVIGIDLQGQNGKDINSLQGLVEDENGKFHPHYWNFKPEYVFHMACFPRVAYSVENPVLTMKNNVMVGAHVLNFARKVGAKRVIYSSSSSISGNGRGPESPYALQKMVTELECKLYNQLYGLDTVSLRYFNVYSEDQETNGSYGTAIANWMQAIRDNTVPYITGDGEQRRDMVHVDDVVSANIFAMNFDSYNFCGEIYDIGTGQNISLNEIKNIVNKHHPKITFDYVEPRPGDVARTKAGIRKLKNIGWSAAISIEDGIDSCFKELKNELS